MDTNQLDYLAVWNRSKPLMTAKLNAIRDGLAGKADLRLSEIIEGGDEEYRLSLDLLRADDLCVLCMDFTLLDAAVNGGEAGQNGVCLSVTGYAALALGGYTPYAYGRNAYTDDVQEIERRIKDLDVAAFVHYIADEALKNDTLQRELAQAA
jgi:hypothetical protein